MRDPFDEGCRAAMRDHLIVVLLRGIRNALSMTRA
jgi:hypothetical protein